MKGVNNKGKQVWKCLYCKCSFPGHNTTKALAHVVRTTGKDIAVCKSFHFIPLKKRQSHLDLYERRTGKQKRMAESNAAFEQSIDSHQHLLNVKYHQSTKQRKRGDVSSTTPSLQSTHGNIGEATSSNASMPSLLGVSNAYVVVDLGVLSQHKKLAIKKPVALVHSAIHNGPNPAGESSLTLAIVDVIHSGGLPFSLSRDPKF